MIPPPYTTCTVVRSGVTSQRCEPEYDGRLKSWRAITVISISAILLSEHNTHRMTDLMVLKSFAADIRIQQERKS